MRRTWIFLALLQAPPVAAADYAVEGITSAPPKGKVSAAIRDSVNASGIKITSKDSLVAELWFRNRLPLRKSEAGELGVHYGKLEQGVTGGPGAFGHRVAGLQGFIHTTRVLHTPLR